MKRLSVLLVAAFVFIILSGVTVFTAFAIDYYRTGEPVSLSDIEEFFSDKDSVTAVIEKNGYQNLSKPTVSLNDERVLNIWETTSENVPLANVRFAIYKVCSLDEYFSGAVKLNAIPTEDDIDKCSTSDRLVTIITTDESGYATHSFGYGENDGVYMVLQCDNAAVKEPVKPFFVSFPMKNADNSALLYTINVYPKNDVEISIPTIEKDITSIGNKQDSFDFTNCQTWIIRTSIPYDIKDAMAYSVIDILDKNLVVAESPTVVIAEKSDAANSEKSDVFAEMKDYLIYSEKVDDHDLIKIMFTDNGINKIADNVNGIYDNYEIRIYIKTKIQPGVKVGAEIKNDADVIYKNSIGQEFSVEVEKVPELVAGGLNIIKLDSKSNKRLSGASFKLARIATSADITAGRYESIYADVGGKTEVVNVVYADFFNNQMLDGNKVSSVTTDDNGNAYMYGLSYGTYYLVETVAPNGYSALDNAIQIVVNSSTHIEGNCVKVMNVRKSIFPSTGDAGAFTVCILLVVFVLSALCFLFTNKKRDV